MTFRTMAAVLAFGATIAVAPAAAPAAPGGPTTDQPAPPAGPGPAGDAVTDPAWSAPPSPPAGPRRLTDPPSGNGEPDPDRSRAPASSANDPVDLRILAEGTRGHVEVAGMETRRIGNVTVSAIGLGAMPMSLEDRPDERRSVATIHAALDAGITLIDTADAYHWHADEVGHNESLIARALASYGGDTSGVLVATKGGHLRPGDGSWTVDGSPQHLREACEGSLKRLGVEAIGLYQFHRPDPRVPYAESVGALRDLLDEGKIRMAGISNANPGQIRLANEILGGRLVSVQNEFSPRFRSSEPELRLCDEMGIAFLPWSPLGGSGQAGGLGQRYTAFAQIAERHGVSPQRLCLAWMLAKSPVVVPIPGSSRPETIRDSAAAVDVRLSTEELSALDAS
jgi:aryl-alcohol dehydrogenase-like predicted oxidoreductase